ncbi:MAG: FIST C-terminal domain-containing protein [Acidobacteria bacterium]|nr:FIST C-terminal domain-containing protein [Acidobacteriota bacterium]
MRAKSAHTLETDPYRAGLALADQLKPLEPDVVILFSSIDYGGNEELLQAFYDVLEAPELTLIGSTGEGFLETGKTADMGACALGLHFDQEIRHAMAWRSGVSQHSFSATQEMLDDLTTQLGEKPDLAILLSDFHADGTEIERAIRQYGVPIVGGFAADDNFDMNTCYIYANQKAQSDAIVVLGLKGPLQFDIHLAHNLEPVGKPGEVTQADKTWLGQVDGQDAMTFVETALGRPVSKVDQGILTLNVLSADNPEKKYLRSIVPDLPSDLEGFHLFGGVQKGSQIQVCMAHPEEVISEVYRVAETLERGKFKPKAGLIFSCAGRKHLLGNEIEHEVRAVRDRLGQDFSVVGFPTFGEIGPIRTQMGWTESFFHNMTYVLLLLGN